MKNVIADIGYKCVCNYDKMCSGLNEKAEKTIIIAVAWSIIMLIVIGCSHQFNIKDKDKQLYLLIGQAVTVILIIWIFRLMLIIK